MPVQSVKNLDVRLWEGHLKDFSANANHASFVGSPEFVMSGNPESNFYTLRTSTGNYASSSTSPIVVTEDFTMEAYFKVYSLPSGFAQVFGANNTSGGFFLNTSGDVFAQISDGTGTQLTSSKNVSDGRCHHIIATVDVDGRIKMWVDGVFHSQSSSDLDGSITDWSGYRIGSYSSGVEMDGGVAIARIHEGILTDSQIAEAYQDAINTCFPIKPKRNIDTAPSVSALSSGSGWNLELVNGKVLDQGLDGNDGTPVTAVQSVTPWGEVALELDGVEGIDCGTDSSLDFTTESFGGWIWANIKNPVTGPVIMGRTNGGANGYFLQALSGGSWRVNINGTQINSSSTVGADGIWNLYGFYKDADGVHLYLDGVKDDTVGASIDPASVSTNFYIGRWTNTSFSVEGGVCAPRIDAFTSRDDFESVYKSEWNRVANKVIYFEDFSGAFVQPAAHTTVDTPVPGTEWILDTISGQIIDGPDLGTKSITSPSVGNSLSTVGSDHTFGRIEIDCTPTTSTRCRHSFIEPGAFSILDVGDSGNNRIAYTTSVGGVVFTTANSSLTTDRQTIRRDKRANISTNNTTLYKDGVQLAASTGSNPCTDITNFSSERQITTYSSAQIHSIKHYFGVPVT